MQQSSVHAQVKLACDQCKMWSHAKARTLKQSRPFNGFQPRIQHQLRELTHCINPKPRTPEREKITCITASLADMRETEVLHHSSHTRLMQALPGHARTDPREHIKYEAAANGYVQHMHVTTLSSKHMHMHQPARCQSLSQFCCSTQ